MVARQFMLNAALASKARDRTPGGIHDPGVQPAARRVRYTLYAVLQSDDDWS